MLRPVNDNLKLVLVAVLTAGVAASAPAIAHGVEHALFAHNADKLDGKTASEFMDSSVYTRSVSTSGQPGLNGTRVAQASCDPEDRVLTGGFVGLDEGTRLINSFPGTAVPVWQVDWENDATADTISIMVRCIDQF